jgi:hypothetical protein
MGLNRITAHVAFEGLSGFDIAVYPISFPSLEVKAKILMAKIPYRFQIIAFNKSIISDCIMIGDNYMMVG